MVQGIVLMRYGEQTAKTLNAVKERLDYIRKFVLPPDQGVDIVPYYDRGTLVERYHAHRDGESSPRHGPGRPGPVALSGQRARRAGDRAQHSASPLGGVLRDGRDWAPPPI